ncbi:nuclear transport factor 2 family protein [Nocardia sp. NPDC020380]|uniref:nuclear transport factor 2 family protein n=1 Tax=Nocardia sp. NPDC020380 TaxID=3364309 RepID=UPI0037974A6A
MKITTEIRCALDDLVAGYALAVDSRDFTAAAALFTMDAELLLPDPPRNLDPSQSHRGRAAIATALSAVGNVERTLHVLGGQVYRAGDTPDMVTGHIAGTAHHLISGAEGHRDLVWQLRYQDTYRHVDDGWLIARRTLTIQWIETRPVRVARP